MLFAETALSIIKFELKKILLIKGGFKNGISGEDAERTSVVGTGYF